MPRMWSGIKAHRVANKRDSGPVQRAFFRVSRIMICSGSFFSSQGRNFPIVETCGTRSERRAKQSQAISSVGLYRTTDVQFVPEEFLRTLVHFRSKTTTDQCSLLPKVYPSPSHKIKFNTFDIEHKSNKTTCTPRIMTEQVHESTGKRRRSLLNKFLTKTYHMMEQCPKDIAYWSNGGESFTIKDVDAFENEILPQYFNHSKFPSFIRQLNFYGFSKQRSDPDLQTHTKAVRFSHEYFRRGRPELLHKIQRTTAAKQVDTSATGQVESLQQQITELREQLANLEEHVEDRVEEALDSVEKAYLLRIRNLEKSYDSLLTTVLSQHYAAPFTTTSYLPAGLSPRLHSVANLKGYADYVRSTVHKSL